MTNLRFKLINAAIFIEWHFFPTIYWLYSSSMLHMCHG